jgi:sterol desaturase/sphingolipid hydroxylase (fatty acid hydroxylase superfamily)
MLGFSQTTIAVYVFIVAMQATFMQANVRWEFPWIRRLAATLCFHHWHHAAEPQAVDKNFSVHSPLWDWSFGTYWEELILRWGLLIGILIAVIDQSLWFFVGL